MITIMPNADRGCTQTTWLDSLHTFSFGAYQNANQMGIGPLRVINEDRVDPEGGFGLHHHENMEILTYVISGSLSHRDSLGNGAVINRGDAQRMTAGTGIDHSEFNPSLTEKVHFLQIWIKPNAQGLSPSYEQKHFLVEEQENHFVLIASPDGRDKSLTIHQDILVYAAKIIKKENEKNLILQTSQLSKIWIQVVSGEVTLNEEFHLKTGDGACLEWEDFLEIMPITLDAEVLVLEIPSVV